MDELRQMQGKNNVRAPKIQQHPDLTDDTDFEQKRYEQQVQQVDIQMNKTMNWQPPPKLLEKDYDVPIDLEHLPQLPEKYHSETEVQDFTHLESTFQEALTQF